MKRPDRSKVLVFAKTADFRSWLEANHDTATEAWIGYYRKGVPKTSQTYDEAVEQALCFGWIDSIGGASTLTATRSGSPRGARAACGARSTSPRSPS